MQKDIIRYYIKSNWIFFLTDILYITVESCIELSIRIITRVCIKPHDYTKKRKYAKIRGIKRHEISETEWNRIKELLPLRRAPWQSTYTAAFVPGRMPVCGKAY